MKHLAVSRYMCTCMDFQIGVYILFVHSITHHSCCCDNCPPVFAARIRHFLSFLWPFVT